MTWIRIKGRCYNKNNPKYPSYGGRGIAVCERWRNSFSAFLEDMGKAPTTQHSIDRHPNNNGNYEPGNCRWATPIEQSNNRRKRKMGYKRATFIEVNGEKIRLDLLPRLPGLKVSAIRTRLLRGWDLNDALNRPLYVRN